jgi:DNA-directed RNA polymerase subunit M/transcription elongation factor TFIIS
MLPKIDVPIYELDLPLSKKKVKFRPFLVKEEKILMMAMESDTDDSSLLAIKQIITNCCLSDNVDIETLPITDLEYFFLNLRARSVGEIVDLQYKCNNKVKDEESGEEKDCGNVVKLEVNVLDIKPEISETHTTKIPLSPNMGIVMKYPSFKMVEDNAKLEGGEIEKLMNILLNCIESVYTEESIFYTKDISKEELSEFVENLTRDQFAKVQQFFDTMPKIKKQLDFTCKKCGYHETINVEGLQSFFV